MQHPTNRSWTNMGDVVSCGNISKLRSALNFIFLHNSGQSLPRTSINFSRSTPLGKILDGIKVIPFGQYCLHCCFLHFGLLCYRSQTQLLFSQCHDPNAGIFTNMFIRPSRFSHHSYVLWKCQVSMERWEKTNWSLRSWLQFWAKLKFASTPSAAARMIDWYIYKANGS